MTSDAANPVIEQLERAISSRKAQLQRLREQTAHRSVVDRARALLHVRETGFLRTSFDESQPRIDSALAHASVYRVTTESQAYFAQLDQRAAELREDLEREKKWLVQIQVLRERLHARTLVPGSGGSHEGSDMLERVASSDMQFHYLMEQALLFIKQEMAAVLSEPRFGKSHEDGDDASLDVFRSALEALMNNAVKDKSAYVTMDAESPELRFFVASGIAVENPENASEIRLAFAD